MILKNFPTEKVKLVKVNSDIIENIDALVEREKIYIDDAMLNIEEGDIIERTLPSGAVEQYVVIDRGFYPAFHGIPAHYQMKVEKQTSFQKSKSQTIVNNNYTINNTERININSTDNSIVLNISDNDIAFMDVLRTLAKGLENEDMIIECIDKMQEDIGKKTFKDKYNTFIQNIAGHMTVYGPFIPALSEFLTRMI